MSSGVVSLLTDFGTTDYYVGALKGTLLRLAPDSRIVDVSHEVDPGDVEEGAFLLGASHRHFPRGTVHLAVVDPGVGGHRRILACSTGTDFFVAPDNGLLSYVLDGAEVRSVEAQELFLDAPGETFHGRDRFAPVAAYLARGESFTKLGPVAENPLRLAIGPPQRDGNGLSGTVVHVDRFGNLISDIPSRWLTDDRRFVCRIGALEVTRMVSHYAALEPDEVALLPGSLGTLEVSMNRRSLADSLTLGRREPIRIDFR